MTKLVLPVAALISILQGCVPNKAYQISTPTAGYLYSGSPLKNYYYPGEARIAFIEFLKDGSLADANEQNRAYELVDYYRNLPSDNAVVFVFIHGWKNNASEASGNVWGFRRTLDFLACLSGRPTLGIYIGWPGVGWPGQNTGFAENLSFSNREGVADKVGSAGPVSATLGEIVRRTKGDHYDGNASLILMGHSFGGIVMESAITPLLKARIESAAPNVPVSSPVDLTLLINEAGPAQLARPFLTYLKDNHVTYQDAKGQNYPLLLSMTSVGDVATRFAFPGGQFFSANKPALNKINPPDEFGIDDDRTYYLLTTANTEALQNRRFLQRPSSQLGTTPDNAYVTLDVSAKTTFDFVPLATPAPPTPAPKNDTPYWVSQIPQIFVPDHDNVFGYQFMRLINEFATGNHYAGASGPSACATPARPLTAAHPRIMLQKRR